MHARKTPLAAAEPQLSPEIREEAAMLLAAARNAAFAEASQGRLGHGLDLLHAALQQEPKSHELLSDMAALLLSAGELQHAVSQARKALEISPFHGPSLYALGFALSGLGETIEARAQLQKLTHGPALNSLVSEAPELLVLAQTELARLETATPASVPAAVQLMIKELAEVGRPSAP
ncbi:hypothetical protein [Pelomonas sp. SE-A7]|uniref:hypothetical protein n=1 Tax=Pelomonas sp. SE-A7 TaxID=3054953 RepID=UPI00259C72A9|nr:hypothetical protein [Pelomonas sp. SE-A7]MDM4764509.1 hypothetical protein [Pelomonas sp. SE-A7]